MRKGLLVCFKVGEIPACVCDGREPAQREQGLIKWRDGGSEPSGRERKAP